MAARHLFLLGAAIGRNSSAEVTRKRGFAGFLDNGYSNFTCEDAALLNLQDSWHYTWQGAYPTMNNKCSGKTVSAEFVPMFIGVTTCPIKTGSDKSCVPALEKEIAKLDNDETRALWKQANARYLLGYNEPDRGNGHYHAHSVSPADAAAAWPRVQALAAAMSPPLSLVSPSVASCAESGGVDAWDDNGHSKWMDEFFGNCTDVVEACDPSLIKYIGMHDYHGSVKELRRRVDGAMERYGRKVWLSEIAAIWGGPDDSRELQDSYMKELLPYLESSDNVFRYAWYSSRNRPGPNGGSNLLSPDDTLTSTGKIYRDAPDARQHIIV